MIDEDELIDELFVCFLEARKRAYFINHLLLPTKFRDSKLTSLETFHNLFNKASGSFSRQIFRLKMKQRCK